MTVFSFDFQNDKPDIRAPIPAGTPLFLRFNYTAGGAGPGGALTQSKSSDAMYLKAELTVLRGPYRGRKFWSNLTVAGGKVDEQGNSIAAGISRKAIRGILDSSQGLKSTDDSPEAAAKRVMPNGFADLQGRQFVAKTTVEAAQGNYAAKNGLGQVLTVDMAGFPTEAQLDAPALAVVPAAALPEPAWTGATAAPAADPTPAPTTTADAAPIAAPEAVATVAAETPAAVTADAGGVPAWMKEAA